MTQTYRIGAQKKWRGDEAANAKKESSRGKMWECDTEMKCFKIRYVAKLSRWHRKQTRGLQRPRAKRKISNFMKREAYIMITFSYHCIRRICVRSPCCRFSLLLFTFTVWLCAVPIVPSNTLPRRFSRYSFTFPAMLPCGLWREFRSTKDIIMYYFFSSKTSEMKLEESARAYVLYFRFRWRHMCRHMHNACCMQKRKPFVWLYSVARVSFCAGNLAL